jgi:hypothetical protein
MAMVQVTDWKRLAAQLAVGTCALAAIVGVTIFALSFRPTKLRLDPGELIRWQWIQTTAPIDAHGKPGAGTSSEQEILLIATRGNEGLLVGKDLRGNDIASLLAFADNGSATLLDAAGRGIDGGRAIGLFDFNLLPLPPGNEQAWNTSVAWAFPPPAKRTLQTRIHRMKAGSKPEFQLKLDGANAVEWLADGTYRQVRNLVVSYRFNGSQRIWDRATMKCQWAVEQPASVLPLRWQIDTTVELRETRDLGDEPEALRQIALAVIEAQDLLNAGGGSRVAEVVARLDAGTVGEPRLRALAARLAAALRRLPTSPVAGRVGTGGWVLVCGELNRDERSKAEQLVSHLSTAGFPAFLAPGEGGRLRILAGPWPAKDEATARQLTARFPYIHPTWREVR